jgi:hypothetical protein
VAATPKDDGEGEPAQDETELDRFRDLARKLVQVPKREIDAEQAKEDERKEQERDGGSGSV